MKTELAHQYCYTCGSILGQKKETYGYNESTGQPLLYVLFKCPNYKWWKVGKHPLTQADASAAYWSGM